MSDSLLEEEQRQKTGIDKGAILTTYVAPPEDSIFEFFKENIPLTGLIGRELDISIIKGHPLFQEGISETGVDGLLPKIGVEWARDNRTESLGMNEISTKPDQYFFDMLNELAQLPDSRRMPSKEFLDKLSRAKRIQQFQWIVQSEVIITGFASGMSGRRVNQWMFEVCDGLLPLIQNDIPIYYPGCSILLNPDSEPNLSSTDFGKPVFGFEIRVLIVQTRNTWREKPDFLYPKTKKFEVHFKGSKTRFEGSFGLETYGKPE